MENATRDALSASISISISRACESIDLCSLKDQFFCAHQRKIEYVHPAEPSYFVKIPFLILGYFRFSVSWILLAVFIYLFRQRQRTQFKQRHRMLNEINKNEEQYVKARLDELPSWVNKPPCRRRVCTNFFRRFSFPMWSAPNGSIESSSKRGRMRISTSTRTFSMILWFRWFEEQRQAYRILPSRDSTLAK